jgi:hypothetical protein
MRLKKDTVIPTFTAIKHAPMGSEIRTKDGEGYEKKKSKSWRLIPE